MNIFDMINVEKNKIYWNSREIRLIIPSNLEPEESFSLGISIIGPDGLPDQEFNKSLRFLPNDIVSGLPKHLKISSENRGLVTIKGLTAKKEGILRLCAQVEDFEHTITSNPCWVERDPQERIYWGDIHVHSYLGGCMPSSTKLPELAYLYARDVARLDIFGLSDHLYGLDSEKWKLSLELAEKYNNPEKFSTILGYESSHPSGMGGDNNVYFNSDSAPLFHPGRHGKNFDLNELWEFLDCNGLDALTIPHHTGRKGKYRSWSEGRYNPDRETLYEIYSGWGSSEKRYSQYPLFAGNTEEAAYFQDALIMGAKFGVIASGDDHTSLTQSQISARFPFGPKTQKQVLKGVTAFVSTRNDRESIFSAMKKRSCYASTNPRTLVRVEPFKQGSVIKISSNDTLFSKRDFQLRVSEAWKTPSRISLLRNNKVIWETDRNFEESDGVWNISDSTPLDKVAVSDSRYNASPFACYYFRSEGLCGNNWWTSPIWFELE
jgi:uncharacterized protein DUF3604